jgi:hypothetical protein
MMHHDERPHSPLGLEPLWMAIPVCVLGIVTRIPFRSQILHHWDSVSFALALDHFDVRWHQPHPPGTFVIYIMLGRLLNAFLQDPNASLVWLSVVLSGLGTAAIFLLSEEWFGWKIALTTALMAIVSPLVWFHGEVALSYMLEYLWVPLVVYSCYKLQTGSRWALLASALLIGMAGGVRPNTPVFLFPLWVLGIIVHKYPTRSSLLALLVMGLGVLVWAVPMVVMSGGLVEYIEVARLWQEQHTEGSASFIRITANVSRFGMYAIYTLGLGLIPLVVATCRSLPEIVRSLKTDWRAQTLFVWVLPATGYFVVIHLHQPGHTFTIQPAFLIFTGLAIVSLARREDCFRQNLWIGTTAVVMVFNALFFLIGPTYLLGDRRMVFTLPTWNAIRNYDTYVTDRLEVIREAFSPEETAVVAGGRNFRLPDFYLSDFQPTSLSYRSDGSTLELADPIDTLVMFDDAALSRLPANVEVQSVSLPGGETLHFFTWDETQVVEVGDESIEIRER